MIGPFPKLQWPPDEFHAHLMAALDDAYASLSQATDFEAHWRSWRVVPGTKTMVRQSPMLGNGGSARALGGFVHFARRYTEAEGKPVESAADRYGFDRYRDFELHSSDDWNAGLKLPLMVAECESNPAELLGELAGLIVVRCPMKYLFIHPSNTLERLNDFCGNNFAVATDWTGTTYYVIEIPDSPSPPSTWVTYRAQVEGTGARMRFSPLST